MSKDARAAKRLGRYVLQLYRDMEPAVSAQTAKIAAEHGGVKCIEGCAHCCRLLAVVSLPEMFPVAEMLIGRSDWPRRRPELRRDAIRHLEALRDLRPDLIRLDAKDNPGRVEYVRKGIPCPLLANERCTVYAVRPGTCRYHVVVSPPEHCDPSKPNDLVARVDLRPAEREVLLRPAEASGLLFGGTLPTMLAYACEYLGHSLGIPDALLALGVIEHMERDQG